MRRAIQRARLALLWRPPRPEWYLHTTLTTITTSTIIAAIRSPEPAGVDGRTFSVNVEIGALCPDLALYLRAYDRPVGQRFEPQARRNVREKKERLGRCEGGEPAAEAQRSHLRALHVKASTAPLRKSRSRSGAPCFVRATQEGAQDTAPRHSAMRASARIYRCKACFNEPESFSSAASHTAAGASSSKALMMPST